MWELEIQTGKKVKSHEKKWLFVDITITMDHRVTKKEDEKIEIYQGQKRPLC